MRVVILPDSQSVSIRAADIFCFVVEQYPDAVLGLATGGTPIGTYQELIRRNQTGQIRFAEATTFNLDEYVGLARTHPQSYWSFMHNNLFSHIDIATDRCYLPSGESDDIQEECHRYEELIEQSGGIDLQILGIGSDGHIGFNEPGSSLASRTRIKALTQRTRQDNARFFGSIDDVPQLAITMGVGTILEAELIVLLATGESTAEAVKNFIEGPVTSMVPASALQMHPNVIALLDAGAATLLQRRDYYNEVEQIQSALEGNHFL